MILIMKLYSITFNVKNLEQIRVQQGLSVREMADKVGISHQKYYDILHKYGQVTLTTVAKISKSLNIHPLELLSFD